MNPKLDRVRKSFVHVFGGSVLTENFFMRNMRFIVILLVIIFLFISHRYTVLQKMSEAESLQRELKDAKYEAITISANLTEAGRQGVIENRIVNEGLELKMINEPVYRIKK